MKWLIKLIKSFRHKALEGLFKKGSTKGIRSDHVKKLRQILAILNAASDIKDVQSILALRCHALTGDRKEEHAVCVNKNWRVTFVFESGNVYLTNYEDYHDGKIKR